MVVATDGVLTESVLSTTAGAAAACSPLAVAESTAAVVGELIGAADAVSGELGNLVDVFSVVAARRRIDRALDYFNSFRYINKTYVKEKASLID